MVEDTLVEELLCDTQNLFSICDERDGGIQNKSGRLKKKTKNKGKKKRKTNMEQNIECLLYFKSLKTPFP